MLDRKLFRKENENITEKIRESQRRRFADVSLVSEVIVLDKQWRKRQFEYQMSKKIINELDRDIKTLKLAQLDPTELIKKSGDLKKEIDAKKMEVDLAAKELDERLSLVANLVHDSVPVDDDEANNSVLWTWGERRPKGKLVNHVDLVNKLQIANLVKGSAVAGGRGYYLNRAGVLLNDALIRFGYAFLHKREYEIHQIPFFMRNEIMERGARLCHFEEELYKVVGDGEEKGGANEKWLVSATEQALCALHLDKRINARRLPMRYAGFSTCFRTEGGSYGGDTLGLYDVDQYEEVSLFCITSPNDYKSWEMHEEMLRIAEDFYKELGLPYRVVNVVSGALNHASSKTYKIEGWLPASETYRELASCSNYTDFVARGLGTKYGQKKGDEQTQQFVHMLNCTLTATEKTMCFILENYQKEDGVVVPEVLRPFVFGNIDFLPFKN